MAEVDGQTQKIYLVREMAWVQEVTTQDVWQWLAKGWEDYKAAWTIGAAYAGIFVLGGFFITLGFHYLEMPYLILPGISGFLLIGPATGVGFYELSRRREKGEPCGFWDMVMAFRRNTLGIMGLGIAMVFLLQVWVRLSFTVFAVSFPGVMPEWVHIIQRALSMEGVYFAIAITALGSVFATLVFFVGSFSMPMLVDRKTVIIPSMVTSSYAVFRNRKAMVLWAALIVVFTGVGLLTLGFGLMVSLPLVGHATWHAYRQVIGGEES